LRRLFWTGYTRPLLLHLLQGKRLLGDPADAADAPVQDTVSFISRCSQAGPGATAGSGPALRFTGCYGCLARNECVAGRLRSGGDRRKTGAPLGKRRLDMTGRGGGRLRRLVRETMRNGLGRPRVRRPDRARTDAKEGSLELQLRFQWPGQRVDRKRRETQPWCSVYLAGEHTRIAATLSRRDQGWRAALGVLAVGTGPGRSGELPRLGHDAQRLGRPS